MGKALQVIGLVIITLVAALYGFIAIGGLMEGAPMPADAESWGMVILSSLTLVSAVVCWVKPRFGAWMGLGVGVLFSIFALVTAGQMHWIAVLSSGFPLLLGGGLMLLGMHLLKKRSAG